MNANRTLALMVIGGALLAWFAAAATSTHDVAPRIVIPPPPVDVQGADLAREISRLHDRLHPDATPRTPSRNLFAYHTAVRHDVPPAVPPPPALTEATARSAPPLPVLKLEGVAEDNSPDGPIRTAIISAEGQLFLVKAGEAIGSRYTVARVGADVVELTDTIDHSTRRLALK